MKGLSTARKQNDWEHRKGSKAVIFKEPAGFSNVAS
jgi:hypothetical protein